ncbi:MAG: hypothetical protein GXP38_10130 [Chloroflexi bacterium]|nr:hypothetical protein [Chloroflexota bacterium]
MYILNRVITWFTVEPAISLLMTITALALFGSALTRQQVTSDRFWPWLRRLIEASVGALLFLGLLWAFRGILNDNIDTFQSTHGSLSEANRYSARSIWGRPHVQRELMVKHYVTTTEKEELPRLDLTQPPLYREVEVRKTIPQNSIIAFEGDVALQLSERQKGYALYSGYVIDARYNYTVLNDADFATETEFFFPLSPGQTVYKNFHVIVDGEDIGSELEFDFDGNVHWSDTMQPGQQSNVIVTYQSRGMDTYYYQIPSQRNIQNFSLTLTIDRLPVDMLNYPEGCLTPTDIRSTDDGAGSILTWDLTDAITVAGMGVALPQPEQPGAKVLRVLWNSPYALTLLGAMLALTLLILGQAVRFLDLALLAGAYSVQFLTMAAISDYFFGFWGSLILGAILTGTMTYLLFRRLPNRLHRILIYALVGFFTILYPLSGLLPETQQRNSFDDLVLVGMIVYLFALSLYTRIEIGGRPVSEES